MRKILCVIGLLSTCAHGLTTHSAKISVVSEGVLHVYEISADEKNGVISLREGKNPKIEKKLKSDTARALVDQANRMVWNAKYKSPPYRGVCQTYVKIQIDTEEQQTVCTQNRRVTGEAFGFLNKIRNMVN